MSRLVVVAALLAVCGVHGSVIGADHPELKAFPPAEKGVERHVVVLPHQDRDAEQGFKVEIVVGRTVLTDGVNRTFLANTIEPRPLEGWGYTFYEVTGSGEVGSTLIGVPPGTPMVEKLVTAPPLLVPYNSRLPIVVYAPEGYVVKYHVWTRGREAKVAEKG